MLVGIVGAAFIGAITNRESSKVTRPPTTAPVVFAATSTSRTSGTKTSASSTTTDRVSTSTSTATVAAPASSLLVPLTISTPSHQDTYSRSVDFGGWSDVTGCQNTRATLLIHTSQVPVTFTTASDCTVKTGWWVDPWSGVTTAAAHDLQIDHTVPLANAWRSGGWAWSHDQRVAYANDLVDPDHLVPILAHENESKSDDGPDLWRPPDRTAWCRYAIDWDRIKAKWKLTATQAEWSALVDMALSC